MLSAYLFAPYFLAKLCLAYVGCGYGNGLDMGTLASCAPSKCKRASTQNDTGARNVIENRSCVVNIEICSTFPVQGRVGMVLAMVLVNANTPHFVSIIV